MADATRCNARFGNKAKTKQETRNNRTNFDHHASLHHARCNTTRCTTLLVLQRNQTETKRRERKNTILHDARFDGRPLPKTKQNENKQYKMKKNEFSPPFYTTRDAIPCDPAPCSFCSCTKEKRKKKNELSPHHNCVMRRDVIQRCDAHLAHSRPLLSRPQFLRRRHVLRSGQTADLTRHPGEPPLVQEGRRLLRRDLCCNRGSCNTRIGMHERDTVRKMSN